MRVADKAAARTAALQCADAGFGDECVLAHLQIAPHALRIVFVNAFGFQIPICPQLARLWIV